MTLSALRPTWHKITHWEYWPMHLVYFPIYLLWGYYAIRARSLFFFNAVNPGIKNGGLFMESKMAIYKLLPRKFYPKTILVKTGFHAMDLKKILNKNGLKFPLIAKPDIGLRGSAVMKINSNADLYHYHRKANFAYLIQDFIPYANEIGVFYVRFPKEKKGFISGLVHKEPLTVTGNGRSNLEELLNQNPRFRFQLKALKKEYGSKLDTVLEKGKKQILVPYGSHCRGAKFEDHKHLITPKLTKTINKMCTQIEGFYYGRLDIMYNSMEELERGKNFMIVEINGAKSEPTHIYDPKHSLFFGWKEIARHIRYMYFISRQNHRHSSASYLNYKTGMREFLAHFSHNKKIAGF